jgi:hypothetical protein
MMKNIVLLWAMAGTMLACKKKETPLPTDFRMRYDKDTVLVTNIVDTDDRGTGLVYITARSTDGKQKMEFTLSGFKGLKGAFQVDYRGAGGNITGNMAMYAVGTDVIMARSGNINVTDVSGGLIKGNFTLFYQSSEMRGTFAAPEK